MRYGFDVISHQLGRTRFGQWHDEYNNGLIDRGSVIAAHIKNSERWFSEVVYYWYISHCTVVGGWFQVANPYLHVAPGYAERISGGRWS